MPGTSLSLIQDGEVVFPGGVSVRELGSPWKSRRRFLVHASNTKGLTTLLLNVLASTVGYVAGIE